MFYHSAFKILLPLLPLTSLPKKKQLHINTAPTKCQHLHYKAQGEEGGRKVIYRRVPDTICLVQGCCSHVWNHSKSNSYFIWWILQQTILNTPSCISPSLSILDLLLQCCPACVSTMVKQRRGVGRGQASLSIVETLLPSFLLYLNQAESWPWMQARAQPQKICFEHHDSVLKHMRLQVNAFLHLLSACDTE